MKEQGREAFGTIARGAHCPVGNNGNRSSASCPSVFEGKLDNTDLSPIKYLAYACSQGKYIESGELAFKAPSFRLRGCG